MGIPLKILTAFSLLSLTHSIYSAYEATAILTPASATPTTQQKLHIPIDITIQTLISTLLLLICIVFSTASLRPIKWNEWAGRIEREGWDPALDEGQVMELSGKRQIGGAGNPYRMLEERRGFWDVRGSREAFASFVRSGGGGVKTIEN